MQSKNAANMPQTMGSGIVKTPYPIKFPLKTRNRGGLLPAYIGGHPLQLNNQATNIGKGPGTYTTVEGKNFGQVTAPTTKMAIEVWQPVEGGPMATYSTPYTGVSVPSNWQFGDIARGFVSQFTGEGKGEIANRLESLVAPEKQIARRLEALYHVRRSINDRFNQINQAIQDTNRKLQSETDPDKRRLLQVDLARLQQTAATVQEAQKRAQGLLNKLDNLEAGGRLGAYWKSDYEAKGGYLLTLGEEIKKLYGVNVFDLYTALQDPDGVKRGIDILLAGIFMGDSSKTTLTGMAKEISDESKRRYDHVIRLNRLANDYNTKLTREQREQIRQTLNHYVRQVVGSSHLGDPTRLKAMHEWQARYIGTYKDALVGKYYSGGNIDTVAPEVKPIVTTPPAVAPNKEAGVTSASRFSYIVDDYLNNYWNSITNKLGEAGDSASIAAVEDAKKNFNSIAEQLKRDYLILAHNEGRTDAEGVAIITNTKERIANTLKQLGQTDISKDDISTANLSDPNAIKNLLSRFGEYNYQQLLQRNAALAAEQARAIAPTLADAAIKNQQLTDAQGKVVGWRNIKPLALPQDALTQIQKDREGTAKPEALAIEVGTQGPPVDINWWRKHMGFYRDEQFRTFQDVYKDPVLKGMYKFDQRIAHLTQLEQDLNAAIANVQATGGYGGALYKQLTDRLQTVRNQLADEINRAQKDKFKLDTIRQTLAAQAPGGKPDESLVQQLFIKYKMAEDWQNMQANAERARKLLQSAGRYTADSAFTPERVAQRWKERWMNEFYQRGMGTTPEALAAFQRDVEDIASGRVTPATLMEQVKTMQPLPQPAPQPVTQPLPQQQAATTVPTPPKPQEPKLQRPTTVLSEARSGFGWFGPSYGPFFPAQPKAQPTLTTPQRPVSVAPQSVTPSSPVAQTPQIPKTPPVGRL